MRGDELSCHALDHAAHEMFVVTWNIVDTGAMKHLHAQALAACVGMNQELAFDIIANLAAQSVVPASQLSAQASPAARLGHVQGRDLVHESGPAHGVHDATRVQPLLGEHLDIFQTLNTRGVRYRYR